MGYQFFHRRSQRGRKQPWQSLPMTMILLTVLLAVLGVKATNRSPFVDGFDLHDHHLSFGLPQKRRTVTSFLAQNKYIGKTDEEGEQSSNKKVTKDPLTVRGGSQSAVAVSQPKRKRQVVPIMVALVIGSFSILEILESLREEVGLALGHAHGIFFLSLIRLSRSLAILQTESEEFTEAVEKLMEGKETETGNDSSSNNGMLSSWRRSFTRFVVSRKACIAACIMASIASITEVVNDLKPGAHHGAVFLALSELNYQVSRAARIVGPGDKPKVESKKRLLSFSSLRALVGPLMFLAAATFSAFEIYEDTRPGAHHGVAVLALAELIENVDRSKVLKRKNRPASVAPSNPEQVGEENKESQEEII
mmetsp:Transcript_27681/g.60957  ORF Transcript_27681/g.60957 Transcript_27681/m.60957 type:complete len:364 (+) Transcript_27681:65-1156(+)